MMWVTLFLAIFIRLCSAEDKTQCDTNHYLVNGTCKECQNGTTVPDDAHDIEKCFRNGHDLEFYATEHGEKLILVCQAAGYPMSIGIRRGNDTVEIKNYNPRNYKNALSVKYNASCDDDWNTFQCMVTRPTGNVSLITWDNPPEFQKSHFCHAAKDTPTSQTTIPETVTDVGAGNGNGATNTSTTADSTDDMTAVIVGSVVGVFIVVVGAVCAVYRRRCLWKTEKPGTNTKVQNKLLNTPESV